MEALPHQITGARFLSDRNYALLADAPRVGKTGAAIMACDDILASRVLVITTASGRPVWVRGFKDWSAYGMPTRAVYGDLGDISGGSLRLVVSWSEVAKHAQALKATRWDVVILDEAHYAKSIDTKRTQAVYGIFRGASRDMGIVDSAARVWCLTGTPIPNAPNDLYPMLRALCPERLDLGVFPYKAAGMIRFEDDVTKYDDFLHRYCVVRRKAISRWTKIDVVVGGKNEAELKARLDGFWLRRTQKDVGIHPPVYEIMPIHISDKQRHEIEAQIEGAEDILAAAETGETRGLEMALGTLRRVTGTVKAAGVADAIEEELESDLDKVVLMCWHRDVMDLLVERLSKYGVVRVDGSTNPHHRDQAVQKFQTGEFRVFIGQIVAAGEAIDLSAAAELVFVESSFVPKDMAQAALRITNHGQTRQTRVRVAALEGSVDEVIQAIVIRKTATLKEIIA